MLTWKPFLIFAAATNSLIVFAWWYTPESPRWLLNNCKKKEAYGQLNEISGLIYKISINPCPARLQTGIIFLRSIRYLFRIKTLTQFVIICLSEYIASFYYNAACKLKI